VGLRTTCLPEDSHRFSSSFNGTVAKETFFCTTDDIKRLLDENKNRGFRRKNPLYSLIASTF
jgi:hypothetical protein